MKVFRRQSDNRLDKGVCEFYESQCSVGDGRGAPVLIYRWGVTGGEGVTRKKGAERRMREPWMVGVRDTRVWVVYAERTISTYHTS